MTLTRLAHVAALALTVALAAQAQHPRQDTARTQVEPAPAIADNSFLMEEAYNQERGVVQHISTFARTVGSRNWAYSLTEEWPAGGLRHQLSYTVPYAHSAETAATGMGDVMLNYRFQAISDEARGLAFSPRLSLSLATGDVRKTLGLGGSGAQLNLPLSKRWGRSFVSHLNAGGTYFPHAPGAGDTSTSLRQISAGHGLIWLANARFNVMLEAVWTQTLTHSRSGSTREDAVLLVPGVRWAYNLPRGLQIVPGLAFPMGVGPSSGTRQTFFYLSFEHPFLPSVK